MARLVFAADSHLNKHYARMTPDQLLARRDKLRAAWQQTVDFAVSERADLYIHGGDLFDSPNPRAAELVWSAGQFQRLADAGVQVLLIGGNHDIPKTRHAGATPQRLFDAVRLAHVFGRPTAVEWWTATIDGTRLAIGGLPPDPRLGPEDDPLAALVEPIEPPEADCVLLVTHYAVEDLHHPLAEEATLRKASIAALAGRVDYLLVGHLHTGRQLEIGGVGVVFPGPTERMTFGELEVRCGFVSLTIEGRRPCRVQLRHIHLDPQPMRRETIRTTDIPADEPTAWLMERVRHCSEPDQILQLRLEGPLARQTYQEVRFLELWQLGHDLNFYFDLDRHGLTVQVDGMAPPAGPGTERVSPRSEIGRVADGLLATAENDQERRLIQAARALVLERYGADAIASEA
jgi:DNA repair exonuclease SbcCD nuclease subunit